MLYMALIYREEPADFDPQSAEAQKMWEDYGAYTQKIIAAGQFKAGDALMPSTTATCVKKNGHKITTTDGPFAETKEQLGGYYLLDCADLDEAVAAAADIPHASAGGTIEVRPVIVPGG
ncbi:MAG: YciI family protein [Pseudomonadota bacterium]